MKPEWVCESCYEKILEVLDVKEISVFTIAPLFGQKCSVCGEDALNLISNEYIELIK